MTTPNNTNEAAVAYVAAYELMQAAMAYGVYVHGAISGLVGAEGNLREALAPQWWPLTPELLREIKAGKHGSRFWMSEGTHDEPLIGEYEWRKGSNPHGFNALGGGRWHASEVSHVMPFIPPAKPIA